MKTSIPWLRVLIEGVVIVGSILLAFGIDAWWDGVQDRREGRVALEEILRDLDADSANQEVTRSSAQQKERVALWALRHIGREDISPDSASRALSGFFQQQAYYPILSAYTGLRDSSRLSLIEDADLRSAIISYYEDEQTRHVWRDQELLTLLRQAWEAAELDLQLATEVDFGGFRVREVELARPWAQIPTDPRFVARLRSLGSRAARTEEFTVRLLRTNSALQQSIRGALGHEDG